MCSDVRTDINFFTSSVGAYAFVLHKLTVHPMGHSPSLNNKMSFSDVTLVV